VQQTTSTGQHGTRPHFPARRVVSRPTAQPTVIQRFEQVVPPAIWLALAGALLFGAASTGWALYSGQRVRRQEGVLTAMSTAAMTDQLTGVLNRRGFLEAVERELARARRYDRGFVLAYVDVRGLKGVNDTEGHRAGDKLLSEAARLLQDSARADDVVGRLGGDEMGLLLVEQGEQGAAAVKQRIEAQVPMRREALGLHSWWDLTIGTATFPHDGETVDDLLRRADLRLYEQRGIDLIDT
jgi:diguanylate cyclase (GGDEF)-like protein